MKAVTRKQIEKVFIKHSTIIPSYIKEILNELFPTPFVPHSGQVIAVWNTNHPYDTKYRQFMTMGQNSTYVCEYEIKTNGNEGYPWDHARPLTQQEKGE